jgi:hypothetical protein
LKTITINSKPLSEKHKPKNLRFRRFLIIISTVSVIVEKIEETMNDENTSEKKNWMEFFDLQS